MPIVNTLRCRLSTELVLAFALESDPTRMCELLVALGEVDLVGIDDVGEGARLVVVIRSRRPRPM